MNSSALEKEVARRKAKEGKAQPVQIATPPAADFSAMLNKLEKMLNDTIAFAESHRLEFDALEDQLPCSIHPEQMRAKLFENTIRKTWEEGYFVPVYTDCPLCQSEAEKARKRKFWLKRGVPERVAGATFETFATDSPEKEAAKAQVMAWVKRGGNFLLLFGTSGTGKGHLAASCLKIGARIVTDGITHHEIDGLFITHLDMLSDLRTSYTLHTTKQVIESWQEAPMFVLDEFGLSGGGNDESPMLYQVLAERYDKRRPTILTSNLSLPDIKEALGPRIFDRMAEDYTVVVCRWASHRTGK